MLLHSPPLFWDIGNHPRKDGRKTSLTKPGNFQGGGANLWAHLVAYLESASIMGLHILFGSKISALFESPNICWAQEACKNLLRFTECITIRIQSPLTSFRLDAHIQCQLFFNHPFSIHFAHPIRRLCIQESKETLTFYCDHGIQNQSNPTGE